MKMKKQIVAPCGIACFNCEMYFENVTTEVQTRLSQITGIPPEKITCNGCADRDYCLFLKFQGKRCKTLDCANEKGVKICCDCPDFPCILLMPLAKGAEKYPHNTKLFNLCTIKKSGIEEWKKQAAAIKKIYFTKNFEIGSGGDEN